LKIGLKIEGEKCGKQELLNTSNLLSDKQLRNLVVMLLTKRFKGKLLNFLEKLKLTTSENQQKKLFTNLYTSGKDV
jgi:hypothetical protein